MRQHGSAGADFSPGRRLRVAVALASVLLVAPHVAAAAPAPPASLADGMPRASGALSVADAVRIGLRESPNVHAAKSEARAAHQETRATRAMTLPQLSTSTFLTQGDMESMLSSSPGVTPAIGRDVPAKGFAMQNVMLMAPIYTGGRLGSMVRAASERERAASEGAGEEQLTTALDVEDAYYRTQLAAELVRVAQARVDAARQLVSDSRALYEGGKGIQASVDRSEAELADAQRMLTSTRNDQAKALLDLRDAMGVSLDSDISLSETLAFAAPPGDLKRSLEEASRTRPALVAARARAKAAGADVGAAKGLLAPQVYGALMAGVSDSSDTGSSQGYTAGITISLPLFDNGQRHAQVAQAQAMKDRAVADERNTELAVANQVRQAWLDIETADQNYRTAVAALTAAKSAYDVIALRVANQKGILVEQLDALTALTQARANLAQALYDHAIAVARLQRAVGRI